MTRAGTQREGGSAANRREGRLEASLDYGPYRALDRLTGSLIVLTLLWGPWALGCTRLWAVQVHNGLGWALGLCFLARVGLRRMTPDWRLAQHGRTNWMDTSLGWLSVLFLAYVLTSALNPRMSTQAGTWTVTYYEAIRWLPYTLERVSTWEAFALYLGMAGLFWAVRDWIKHPPRAATDGDSRAASALPARMRVLLWVLCVNGAVLAAQGIAQRVAGSKELLWLAAPEHQTDPLSWFGPWAYRANASQYFNLLWPVALGFWWTYRRAATRRCAELAGAGTAAPNDPVSTRLARGNFLVPAVLLMAVCPVVATSRGGTIILVTLAVAALAILGLTGWRGGVRGKLALAALVVTMLGFGYLLGWQDLGPRMKEFASGYQDRAAITHTAMKMAAQAPFFGTGAGTFNYLFQFYWPSSPAEWLGPGHDDNLALLRTFGWLHNDWLELRITLGWPGLLMLLAALALTAGHWFSRRGLAGEQSFVFLAWCALGGCLLHARFDFPFRIASIVALFLVLCAMLSCLSRHRSGRSR